MTDCLCHVRGDFEIIYCPLHEAAPELLEALEYAVTRLEDNERWWHQARTLTTLTAFERQAFEARAQTTRTTLDQLRMVLGHPARKATSI